MSRLFDFFKGVLSLAAIGALLIGVPWVLITFIGFPLPTSLPSPTLIGNHLTNGDIPNLFVLKTLALIVWVVWVQLAVAIVVESLALVRGRVSGRVPVLPGLQALVGGLVASTVLVVSSLTPGRPAMGTAPIVPIDQLAAPTGPAASPHAGDAASLAASMIGGPGAPVGAETMDVGDPGVEQPGTAAPRAVGQYATSAGDNWWDIAERLLGDGMRWSELRDLNAGKTMLTGEVISTKTEVIRSGWRLDVPADAEPTLLDKAVSVHQVEAVPPAPVAAAQFVEPVVEAAPPPPTAAPESVESPELPGTDVDREDAESDREDAGLAVVYTMPVAVEDARPDLLVYEGPTGAVDLGPGVPYQVTEGDNLWDIADRHLGDPLRWPEIFERSTDLEQSFGRTISDPNLIWPDSILWLPTDAHDVPQADGELVADVVGAMHPSTEDGTGRDGTGRDGTDRDDAIDDEGHVTVMPEDLERAAAAAAAAAGLAAAPDAEAGAGTQTSSSPSAPTPPSSSPPSSSPPSSATSTATSAPPPPTVPTPSPSAPAAPPQSMPPPSMPPPSAPPPSVPPPPGGPGEGANGTNRSVPVGITFGAGGVLVASGLLGLLRRSRRLRLAEAGERSHPELPPFELVEIETVLRNSSDVALAASVHRAIASLANRPIVVGEPVAAPEVIRFTQEQVEVLQHRYDPDLPQPWVAFPGQLPESLGDRTVARTTMTSFVTAADGEVEGELPLAAAPTCVSVGRGLMANLESLGVVSIAGSVEDAAGLVRSMIHELATGPARRSVEVRVSDWLPGADLHAHVSCGPLDGLSQQLQGWLEAVDLGLAGSGGFSAYAMRAAGDGAATPHPIVIFAESADAPHLISLAERASEHAVPLAIVFSGDLAGTGIRPRATLDIDGEVTTLEPFGFVAATQHLDDDLMIGTEALLTHARQAPMVARTAGLPSAADVDTDQANASTEETPEHDIATERPQGEEPEVTDQSTGGDGGMLIRVLGPLTVEGGPDDLVEEELSLLAFLALVGPSTREQILDAVWPGGQLDDGRFDQIVERLQADLQHRFSATGDGRYRVRSIVTDLGSARRWLGQADALSPDRSRNLLEMALSDVRGEPFAGVSDRWWQWAADHKMAIATQATTMLMDACFDLCDSAYGASDLHLAKWACDVGALIDPVHETVAIRRVQLMQVLGMHDEALDVVSEWERLFTELADRPPPRGPRAALGALGSAPSTMAAPSVS